MSDTARPHASQFIDEFLAAQAPIAASASTDEFIGPDQFLDLLERVEAEREWLRSHRAEWAGDDRGPWNMYRILLLELQARLVELVERSWDILAANNAKDREAALAAAAIARQAASRAGTAVGGLLSVQEAMGNPSRGN